MTKIFSIPVETPRGEAAVALYHGDLTSMPEDERVDLLVVSAFPGDYTATATSLIGALAESGLSIATLAHVKAADLRTTFGCWLSPDLRGLPVGLAFHRVMCFEPATIGKAPEVVGDLFRAVTPYVLGPPHVRSLAMPLIAAGDQREDRTRMLRAIVEAGIAWLKVGLPITSIKIVERDRAIANELLAFLKSFKPDVSKPLAISGDSAKHDYFISYSRQDQATADLVATTLTSQSPNRRVFLDRKDIAIGSSWQQVIWKELACCDRVIALLSGDYFLSKMCQEEYSIAMLRHREASAAVLYPVYVRTTDLPPHVRILNYVDCREADSTKLHAALRHL